MDYYYTHSATLTQNHDFSGGGRSSFVGSIIQLRAVSATTVNVKSGGWLNGRALRICGEGPGFDSDPRNGHNPIAIGRPGPQIA